jgi:xylulokinase
MSYLLGIDIGTSSAKAILFDPDRVAVVAVANHEYAIHKPAPDRAEQNPDDWWHATFDVIRRVLSQVKSSEVAAIGLSGQMHGGVFLGKDAQPLCPAIIWADQRSTDASLTLIESLGEGRYAAIAGTLPAVGFLASTLVWIKQHNPALLERINQFVLPKDYVRLRMTGEIATDISDAASTALFDIRKRDWSSEILNAAGLPTSICPRLYASSSVAGFLTRQAAEALGLRTGLPVVAGCADQPAQAIGSGLIAPGKASVTTGTGGQVFTPVHARFDQVKTDPRLHVFNHAVPDTWYILGAILAAGLSLRWLRNLTGLEGQGDAYSILSAEASSVSLGADGLIFLPYLSGERTPHMDALARGSFIGLSYHHRRGHLARAVMEGVAFALRQTLEISLALGGTVERIIVAGGGAESGIWRQIQADVLGLPLQKTLLTEQAGVGAALVAGVGTGVYKNFNEACSNTVRYDSLTEPNANNHARYNELYNKYLELYPRLRDDFHWLAHFGNELT